MKTGIRKALSLVSAAALAATTIATSIFVTYAAGEDGPVKKELYNTTVAPNSADMVAESAGKLFASSILGGYYAFTTTGASEGDRNGVDGSFTVEAKPNEYITNFRLEGAGNTFGGSFEFYASSTGESDDYEAFTPEVVRREDQPQSWSDVGDFYYTFDAADKIRFIQIKINKGGEGFVHQPSVKAVHYDFELGYEVKADSKKAATDYIESKGYPNTEGGEEPTLHAFDSDKQFDGVVGQLFSTGESFQGELVFQVPKSKALKATGILNGLASTKLQFEVSEDKNVWTKLDTNCKIVQHIGETPFYGAEYYGNSSVVFEYLKVVFPKGTSYSPILCNIYTEVIDSEFEKQYGNVIPANDPSVTLSVEDKVVLKETDALKDVDADTKYYAFGKDVTTGSGEDAQTTTEGVSGSLDFKGDGKTFTDVCVKAAVGPGDTINFYKSVDPLFNRNEDAFKVKDVSVRKIADLPGGGSLNYYYFTLPAEEEYRYIRVELLKEDGDKTFGLPAVASIMYNGVDVIDYEYRIGAGDYFDYSTEEGASFTQNSGVYHFNKDGSSVDGTVTYKSDYVISQFNVRILKSDAPSWAGDFTYWVSETGEDDSWVQLLPEDAENPDGNPVYKTQAIRKYPNTGWDSSYYNIYGDLDTSGNYHYIQIRADINNATSFPLGPQYVQFNTEGEPDSYDYLLNPSQAYKIEAQDGGTLTNFQGVYLFHKTEGESTVDTAGAITFAAPYYFTDFSIRVVMPNALQCDTGIRFEAYKADGTTLVEDFKPMISRDRRHNTGWGSAFFDVSGKLDESDGVKYIKVIFTGGGNTYVMPAITEFKYNLPDQPSYTEKVMPAESDTVKAESENGTYLTGQPEIPEYYVFIGKIENDKGEQVDVTVPGTVTFESPLPITDYSFRIIEGMGGTITYSASKDGKTWTPITDYAKKIVGLKHKDWGPGYIKNVYGALPAEDEIHYLRVELNGDSTFAKLPVLAYVEYNMDGVIRPDIYRHQQSAEEAKVDSEGTLTASAANGEYFNFQKNGAVVDGSLIFEAEDYITDLSIDMLKGAAAEFYYSADGAEWTAFVPEMETNGDYAEYYTKLPNGPVARFIRVDLKGDAAISGIAYNTGARYYEQLPDTPDIEDLDLPTKDSPFATGQYGESIFKLNGMTITNNGEVNGPYIGGGYGNFSMVQTLQDGDIILYTPGMKDFKFVTAYSGGNIDKFQYKAYGRKTQYGEETEIPLMRTKLEREGDGFEHSQFRPTEEARETLDDYLYLRIEGKSEGGAVLNMLHFTFFYDGEEPGEVPKDENAGGEGTDRTNVKTYNFIKGNMNPLRSENMIPQLNNIGNVDYIGTEYGYTVEKPGQDGFVTFRADGITKFYVKVHMIPEYVGNLKVKILVAPEDDDSQYVEIPLTYELTKDQPTGWISVEYMPAEGAVIPKGSNYIKYLIEDGDASSQLVRIDYEYEAPEAQRLPDWTEPNTDNGQKELLDRFEGEGLTMDEGGLAYENFQMNINGSYSLGGENGSARVIEKIDPYSDASLYYQVDGDVDFIDVRGYRRIGFESMPVVWVSADGEDWTMLENGEEMTVPLFDGPQEFSWQLSDIPEGMRYVRVDIPELENLTDLVLHGVQILFGDGTIDDGFTDTGVALPLAGLTLAGAAGAVLLVSRKRRGK